MILIIGTPLLWVVIGLLCGTGLIMEALEHLKGWSRWCSHSRKPKSS